MEEVKRSSHKCVMCGAEMVSKPDLQEHFRRHANGEIDMKGRPKGHLKSSAKPTEVKTDPESTSTEKTSPVIQCDTCTEVFDNLTAAIQHKFKKHPGSQKKYYCQHCG